MKAEQLFMHYARIADAPNAVARLRRFILDLAVRGKLVSQDPRDEPSELLLNRIAAEKTTSAKTDDRRSQTKLPAVEDEEAPFSIPSTWCWTRLGEITSYLQRGRSPRYAETDGVPVISQKCVQWRGLDLTVAKRITQESLIDYEPIRFLRDGDLLWNSTGTGTIGRVIRLSSPPEGLVCDSHVTVVRCSIVNPEFVRTWLRSDQVYSLIEERAAGSTNQVELTGYMAAHQIIPLPPTSEQNRIVTKVQELMALCDRLEVSRETREATRDKLLNASLARLNIPNPDSFRDDVRFALSALPALTARPDQIEKVRQTILHLAVRGKLVPQDRNDEPAETLLAKFAESADVGGKGRDWTKGLATSHDQAFPAPQGWVWTRIAETAERVTVGYVGPMKDQYLPSGVPFLRSQNVRANRFRSDGLVYISNDFHQKIIKSALAPGDVVVVRSGNVGTSCVIPPTVLEANCSDLVVVKKPTCVVPTYLCFYLNPSSTVRFTK
jgi:type I restriction enzyme, S subunit